MKFLSLAGIICLAIASVRSGLVRRDVDPDGLEDVNNEEVLPGEEMYFEDDNGNLVKITDEEGYETVEETEARVSERVFFHLYTRTNPEQSQELIIGDKNVLKNSNWDPRRLTRIVTHGWTNSHESDACVVVRDAYLENGDHNVVVVDWSRISQMPYGAAVRRVRTVAGYIAQMIDFLEEQGLDISQLVIVGHSLGGHIAGISGHLARNTVGHVVSLDPAGPYFWYARPGYRVDKGDAANVQVIHTNDGQFGLDRVLGHIDFYPNGGVSQPKCGFDPTGICAHASAFRYFAESINSGPGFHGQLCGSWRRWRYGMCANGGTTYMGGNRPTPVNEEGTYFFRTANSSPFALGPL